jgi:hypothetical protein
MTRELVAERLQPKGAALGDAASYTTIKCLGVAVTRIAGHAGPIAHAGILYRRKTEVRLFEMRSHKELCDAPARSGFVWIEPSLPPERLALIIGRLRLVYDSHKRQAVPYGFKWRKSSFDEKGGLRLGDGEIGFTCSTSVAALLEAEGLSLVSPDTWPPPDSADKAVRKTFLDELRKKDPEHAKLLQTDIEAPRIGPEEVVAAAGTSPPPASFQSVQDGAAVVRARIGT